MESRSLGRNRCNLLNLVLFFCLSSIFFVSCNHNKEVSTIYDNRIIIELTDDCLVQWDSITWELKYFTSKDTLFIEDLVEKILDTNETKIIDCYYYMNEDSTYNFLTIGQLSFWVLKRELKISLRNTFDLEMTTLGQNVKDTTFSICPYPMYMMDFVHDERYIIYKELKNKYFDK